jgi:hypothetical protein
VVNELQPSFPPIATADFIQQAMKAYQGYPYACFIEKTSGLLVLITFSGYCLKFQLEVLNTNDSPTFKHDKY